MRPAYAVMAKPSHCPFAVPMCMVRALRFAGPRMARDQIDMTPIETRDELVAWLEAGCKPAEEFRVGTEHEKFAFTVEDHRPVPYAGRRSIRSLLDGMVHLLGWEPIMEGDNIIGMFDVTGGGAISLEPGGIDIRSLYGKTGS